MLQLYLWNDFDADFQPVSEREVGRDYGQGDMHGCCVAAKWISER